MGTGTQAVGRRGHRKQSSSETGAQAPKESSQVVMREGNDF